MIEKEIWKDIIGYKGLYQVSNLGNVKSKNGLLKARTIFNNRYLIVTLCMYGIPEEWGIHVLVAQAFKNFIPGGCKFVIDHIDENPLNNRENNLRILTHRQNVMRSINKDNTYSKYTGVTYQKHREKWYCSIKILKVSVHLGTHPTNQLFLSTLFEIANKYRTMFDGDSEKFRSFIYIMYLELGYTPVDTLITINLKDLTIMQHLITKGNIRDDK